MMMKSSHIRENIFTEEEAKKSGLKTGKGINYHGLGKDLFIKVIDGLENVKYAYRGTKNADDPARRENYFLLISQYRDKEGNIINVPVYINKSGQYNKIFISTNKIATAFGRSDFYKYIQREVKKGNLVKIKNRSNSSSELTAPIAAGYVKNASENIIRTEEAKSQEKTKFSLRNVSNRDSEGNELTKEQQEFFKNSKVRDEDGNLKVMYHGTPNGTFTIFNPGTYFTDKEWYADLYQNQGASSLGYKILC